MTTDLGCDWDGAGESTALLLTTVDRCRAKKISSRWDGGENTTRESLRNDPNHYVWL